VSQPDTQPSRQALASRRYHQRHPERMAAQRAAYLAAHYEQERARWKRYQSANLDKIRVLQANRRDRLRSEVFAHYGQACACCGSTDRLTIDHIAGTGADHRKELFGGRQIAGTRFYAWLIRQGFPDGYQTLCAPCNRSKGTGARCRMH
jgi:hypothetical protein